LKHFLEAVQRIAREWRFMLFRNRPILARIFNAIAEGPSVRLALTLMSQAYSVPDIETHFAGMIERYF